MNKMYILTMITSVFLMVTFIFFLHTPCSAQLSPFFTPYLAPFAPGSNFFYSPYNTFFPFFSPLPGYSVPILNPIMTPLISTPPSISRSAATTIIVLPQATTPVTAYAPLGTLNLTPSTLVFLILLFTLHE